MKRNRRTKGGYPTNKNGVPLDIHGGNVFNTNNYSYTPVYTKVGKYRPTIHNLSII